MHPVIVSEQVKQTELTEYQTIADALIRLNRAASTLLKHGANPEAIKLILTGTAQLFSELEEKMSKTLSPEDQRSVQLNFPKSEGGFRMDDPGMSSEA